MLNVTNQCLLEKGQIESKSKIDIEELLHAFRDIEYDPFKLYVKSIWQDLVKRSDKSDKGVNKLTFQQYYQLPGIISERIFTLYDYDKDGYLNKNEFYDGMITLFIMPYQYLIDFIFKIYDFDSDGKITQDDVKSIMQYITLNKSNLSLQSLNFADRVESQNEIKEKIDTYFGRKREIDSNEFSRIVEEVNSDLFVYLLLFLLQNRPFSNKTVEKYKSHVLNPSKSPKNEGRLIMSPSEKSSFSPTSLILKSPLKSKYTKFSERSGENILKRFPGLIGNNPISYEATKKEKKKSIKEIDLALNNLKKIE